MTSIIMSTLIVLKLSVLSNSKNPMKASFLILALSSMMFLSIKMETGEAWFPLIFFMLFTGGILMMFMILSSVLPNEKAYKMKHSKISLFLMMTMMLMISTKLNFHESNLNQMKSFISSSMGMSFMILIILIYFFNSININSTEEYPMRSFLCWKKKIL